MDWKKLNQRHRYFVGSCLAIVVWGASSHVATAQQTSANIVIPPSESRATSESGTQEVGNSSHPFATQQQVTQADFHSPLTPVPSRVSRMPQVQQVSFEPAVHALTNVSIEQFESSLLKIWGRNLNARQENDHQVSVQLPSLTGQAIGMLIDYSTNVVAYRGPQDLTNSWLTLMQWLDVAPHDDKGGRQLVGLADKDPASVKNVVAELGLQTLDTPKGNVAPATSPLATTQLIQQEQQETPPSTLVPLGSDANAGNGAPNILSSQDDGVQGTVRVQVIEELNSILLIGDPEDVAKVRSIIEALAQTADDTQPEVRIIELQRADSTKLKPLVEEVYEEMYVDRTGPANITSIDHRNALMVIGQAQAQDNIAALVAKLDVESTGGPAANFRHFPLQHMSARDALLTISAYFFETDGASNDTVDAATVIASINGPIIVIQDFRSNSLIVKGSPENIRTVEELLARLDVAESAASQEVRVIPLRNALADDLALVLQSAINGDSMGHRKLTRIRKTNLVTQGKQIQTRKCNLLQKCFS